MSFDKNTATKDITQATDKSKSNPDFSNLLRDIQNDAGKDSVKLRQDVDIANAVLKEQGFPTLTIEDGQAKLAKTQQSDTTTKPVNQPELKREGDNITDIKFPNGKEVKIHYTNNEIDSYVSPGGTCWAKEGENWRQKTPDGKQYVKEDGTPTDKPEEAVQWKGSVAVDKTGVMTIVDEQETRVRRPDGTSTITEKNSGAVTEEKADGSSITHDTAGNITDIKFPNGKGVKIHYTNNEIDSYISPGGTYWVKEGENWRQKTDDGKQYVKEDGTPTDKPEEAVTWKGSVTVDKVGVMTIVDEQETRVRRPDGTSTITDKNSGAVTEEKADGSSVTHDTKGNITEIKYPHGKTAKFEYDGKEQLTGYTDQEGRHWKKEDDGVWRQKTEDGQHYVDKNGTQTDNKEDAVTQAPVSIDKKNGDLTFEDGKNKKVVHADGTVSEIYQGRRTEISVNETGASHVVKPHETLWAIAEDNWSRMHNGTKPSVKEIQAEMDRIVAKYNEKHKGQEIKNKNRIAVNMEFDLA